MGNIFFIVIFDEKYTLLKKYRVIIVCFRLIHFVKNNFWKNSEKAKIYYLIFKQTKKNSVLEKT